jgi:hypothetical protein
MSKKRRVEIQIEHREISIFSGRMPSASQSFHPPALQAVPVLQVANLACPTCGSPHLVSLAEAISQVHFDVTDLNQGMQDGRIHYHRSPSGEWWLCSKSLQQT